MPELRESLGEEVTEGTLILNLRAEDGPENLQRVVEETVARLAADRAVVLTMEHLESFRPGQPNPVYRDTVGAVAMGSCSA